MHREVSVDGSGVGIFPRQKVWSASTGLLTPFTNTEALAMTETEWLRCEDPDLMLAHVKGNVSSRKLRLFAVACCRHVWHLLRDERIQRDVEIAEQYADGLATEEALARASKEAYAIAQGARAIAFPRISPRFLGSGFYLAEDAAAFTTDSTAVTIDGLYRPAEAAVCPYLLTDDWEKERDYQCGILRDLLGNPFSPKYPEFTATAAHIPLSVLAQAIYEDRSFEQLPALADVLERNGCTVHEVLDHCRLHGIHARGCWIIDLLLGRN
jgi:hypothetical protein